MQNNGRYSNDRPPQTPGSGTGASGRASSAAGARRPVRRAVPGQPGRRAPEPPETTAKKPPIQKGNRWFRAILMVVATLGLCIFLSLFILDSAQDLFGLNQPDNLIEVEIPEGASNKRVADILSDRGVISKPLTFSVYAGLKVEDGGFVPGKYLLNTNMGYDEIILYLEVGNSEKEEVRITFIEGKTLQEFAQQLEDERVCDADEFIKYLEEAEFSYEFVDRMGDDPLRFRRMEGYIFPDTYDFYVGEKVDSVAKKFLDNFQRRITEDMEKRMQELNLTLDETITLASVIQKEAGDPEEMKRVSSVFHNRLDNSAAYPKLQSDVTIYYVERLIKPYLATENQEMYDAYNTYECDGLPVGPICNPGLDAINAALYPEASDNYFFVTDVNGKYYYAVTAEEHYEKVALARAQKSESDTPGEVHGTNVRG